MRVTMVAGLLAVIACGCAAARQQWQAQQAAEAQAQAAAQPANMEQLCRPATNAYCTRCNIDQATCGQTYINCVGSKSPADPSGFTFGQVDQCVAAVQAGDCNVMPTVWPADCVGQTPAEQPQPQPQPPPQPDQAQQPADPQQPACTGGSQWDGSQCVCPAGTSWDGSQCACPAGSQWDGSQCVADQPASAPQASSGDRCRTALINKGYAPDQLPNCEGVNDRCAVALIHKGYEPGRLIECRGVDGKCAEAMLMKGYAPDQLINCRH